MLRSSLAVLVAAFACCPARADSLPPPVAAAVRDVKASCGGAPATIGKGFLRRQDVTGDGLPDYVISYAGVSCPTGGHMKCGSGGCLTQVFASTPGGYVEALNQNVQKIAFRTRNGKPAVVLDLNGSECGRFGYQVCKSVRYWNGTGFVAQN
ncbi:hypothetical protein Q8W71_13085 [Methylobacterium sp. NEAU 140]|uniref:hypothetical protein n=1 Tax=Methylobacterium sp. NEAU 140 TaxID=3064945 RepID=UPI002733400C|nr:hypothetical protein [Methylobacterium sp. NEAU 140]MDP4023566.1 hypothetical protein [Methylobacterium sp. NEAU 140]